MEKLIITCALTGAEVTKQQNSNVPLTPDEIAEAALAARQAGASIVHLHARQPDGTATQDRAIYAEIIEKIRESGNDVIVQVSTGGAVGMTVDERIQPVTLKPEMSSLNSGSVNFGNSVFLNAPPDIERFAQSIKDHGVLPELEIYDVGMIRNAIVLMEKGLVPKHAPFNLVMGVPGAIPGTPRNLMFLVESASWF
jgi:3-keto-5-aminohexanoate cleavage enzyme